MTQCTTRQLEFHGLDRREIVARFDGGEISSDGGALLLREVDQRLGLGSFAPCRSTCVVPMPGTQVLQWYRSV